MASTATALTCAPGNWAWSCPDAIHGPKCPKITEDCQPSYLLRVGRRHIVISFRAVSCCCFAAGAVPVVARGPGDPFLRCHPVRNARRQPPWVGPPPYQNDGPRFPPTLFHSNRDRDRPRLCCSGSRSIVRVTCSRACVLHRVLPFGPCRNDSGCDFDEGLPILDVAEAEGIVVFVAARFPVVVFDLRERSKGRPGCQLKTGGSGNRTKTPTLTDLSECTTLVDLKAAVPPTCPFVAGASASSACVIACSEGGGATVIVIIVRREVEGRIEGKNKAADDERNVFCV